MITHILGIPTNIAFHLLPKSTISLNSRTGELKRRGHEKGTVLRFHNRRLTDARSKGSVIDE
jgi:hypothetical protein